jgi:hypothetical protein
VQGNIRPNGLFSGKTVLTTISGSAELFGRAREVERHLERAPESIQVANEHADTERKMAAREMPKKCCKCISIE